MALCLERVIEMALTHTDLLSDRMTRAVARSTYTVIDPAGTVVARVSAIAAQWSSNPFYAINFAATGLWCAPVDCGRWIKPAT